MRMWRTWSSGSRSAARAASATSRASGCPRQEHPTPSAARPAAGRDRCRTPAAAPRPARSEWRIASSGRHARGRPRCRSRAHPAAIRRPAREPRRRRCFRNPSPPPVSRCRVPGQIRAQQRAPERVSSSTSDRCTRTSAPRTCPSERDEGEQNHGRQPRRRPAARGFAVTTTGDLTGASAAPATRAGRSRARHPADPDARRYPSRCSPPCRYRRRRPSSRPGPK